MGEGAWIAPLAGGALIGAAAALMMGLHGRIAGISGVLGGILTGDRALWRGLFVGGLVAGGLLMSQLTPSAFPSESSRSMAALIVAGLAVGVGTRMGNGCTSGHGVCGIARGSRRSIVATVTFIATGALTVWVVGALGGHV